MSIRLETLLVGCPVDVCIPPWNLAGSQDLVTIPREIQHSSTILQERMPFTSPVGIFALTEVD